MRQQLRDGMMSLGRNVRNFDDAYSQKIAQMYEGANPAVKAASYMIGGAHPSLRRGELSRGMGPETRNEQMLRNAMEYGVPAMNAVPKYVVPIAGVTAAGMGLIELTNAFTDQQTATTVMPR